MAEARKSVAWARRPRTSSAPSTAITAKHILDVIDNYLTTGAGDVKKLRPPRDELRLRAGDYRVFFYQLAPLSIRITGVKHRSEAYR